jgi:hypothetical protein
MTDTPHDKINKARDTGTPNQEVWAALAAPFSATQIETLPRNVQQGDRDRGQCRQGTRYSADGTYCGGYHARSVHLDYVGHAGITMRLNEVVTPAHWSWEPVTVGPDGAPVVGREFWIRLTVMGVTKLGVGDDFNGSAKQAIGDALRNAAMRFGIGTYLWSKSDAALNLRRAEEDAPVVANPAVGAAVHAAAAATRALQEKDPGKGTRPAREAATEAPAADDRPTPVPPLASKEQRSHLVSLLGMVEVRGKEKVLEYLTNELARPVTSTEEISWVEARKIIDELEAKV